MVGNSLSFCIKEIVEGSVDEKNVTVIRCSFEKPKDRTTFIDTVIDKYCAGYWKEYPDKASAIALKLYDAGKLEFTGGHYLTSIWGAEKLHLIDPVKALKEKIQEFVEEVIYLYKKYGLSISHEDGHGAFEIEPYSDRNAEWLRAAHINSAIPLSSEESK